MGDSNSSTKINIMLFGGCRILLADGRELALSSKKGKALIVYLSQCPGMAASRDKIAGLFWDDTDNEHSRNSLRQTLSVVRRDLSASDLNLLVPERDGLAILPSAIACDTHEFLASLNSEATEALEAAAALYSGPFLDGFYSGSGGFDDWAAAERERFAGSAVVLLEKLTRRNEGEVALHHARRLIAIDPAREASYHLKMELLAANGHRERAIKTYEACVSMLKQEYGVAPSEETRHLLDNILKDNQRTKGAARPAVAATSVIRPVEPTIEINPFVSLSGERSEDHVARGLTRDITSALSRERLIVVASGEAFHELRTAAKADGSPARVSYGLNGGVQIVGQRIRVNLQLMNTETGHTVWGERLDGNSEELLEFQDRVTQVVTVAARIELQLTSWNVRDKSPPGSPEIRKLINQSLTKYYEMTRESLLEAIVLAERALKMEPDTPRAVRTLSIALSMSMAFGAIPMSPDNMRRALESAEFAVGAVPDDEIARTYLAFALLCGGRHHEAISELKHAIEINPDYPNARGDIAEHYALMGQTDEALREATAALRTTAYDPIAFWRHHYVALAKFAAGDDMGALESARRVAKLKPGFVRGTLYWAAAAAATGNSDEASRAVQHSLSYLPYLRISNVSPGFVPRYIRDEHQDRFLRMLARGGMPA